MAVETPTPEKISFGPVAGEVYERSMGRWSRRLAPLLLDFTGTDPDTKRILDAGCGTGSLAFALAERSPAARITGCDIAEPLLDHARSTNPHPDRITFEEGDICGLPYKDGQFDAALSSLVLMFVPDAERAAREMTRVTRPGGTVAAATWDFRGGMPQLRTLLDTTAALDEEAASWRSRLFSSPGVRPGHLTELWHRAGLVDIRETTLAIRMEFRNFADYWEPSAQSGLFGAIYRALPSDRQTLLRDKVQAAYLVGDPDGPRSFTATAWAVAGTANTRTP